MRLILAVFLGLTFAQFKNDRLLARFENSAVKLKNADKKKGPNLECGSDKIEISFEMAELEAMKLGVDDPTKIFFRGNKNCFSVLDGTKEMFTARRNVDKHGRADSINRPVTNRFITA
ncbi:Oidioi.mRNA.OKI2018_I69.XSR.g13519.t1.cds [Oikopleura dioica]|uniref:Oidioi.mRNA.OKI2018_I69.XSR.g13519.t1.cds n=1 Tax=Oikopleura dioica TaxID=34765 RepID=A0ABN7SBU1_OIKDI|nr:Oidioi.mRNA.OKI2018_I69.XSR.g13519.t1.cds [Oikopleura dioica]